MSKNKMYKDYSKISAVIPEPETEAEEKEDLITFPESDEDDDRVEEPVKKVEVSVEEKYKVVDVDLLNIRNKPDSNGDVIGKVNKDKVLIVTGFSNDRAWATIKFGGRTAYVMTKFLAKV